MKEETYVVGETFIYRPNGHRGYVVSPVLGVGIRFPNRIALVVDSRSLSYAEDKKDNIVTLGEKVHFGKKEAEIFSLQWFYIAHLQSNQVIVTIPKAMLKAKGKIMAPPDLKIILPGRES